MRTRDIERLIRVTVREEVRKEIARLNLSARPARRRPCGTGSSPPLCMGSAHHGPRGCTCR